MSKFLSLNWFKSKIENTLEKVITNKLQDLMEQEDNDLPGSDYDVDLSKKPYLNVKMVNDVLTIVLNDGNIISKPNATQDDFIAARNARTEQELFGLVVCPEVREERRKREAEIARMEALNKGIQSLGELSDFTVKENTVYLTGIDRSLPQILVEEFLDVVETQKYYTGFGNLEADLASNEKYQSLKRFFMWCCLNPRAEVAHELYRFLKENSFRITKQGFFVALRNVVTLHGSPELVHFVSNAYNKVKAVWKKKPDDYTVFLQNGEYKLVHNADLFETKVVECDNCDGTGEYWDEYESEEYGNDPGYVTCNVCDGDGTYEASVPVEHGQQIGGLTELYLDLPNREENRFTDDWTKTFDIRIGRVVNMPMDQCNWSTQDCAAAGLHFTADQIHYVGCGDQSVLVLINPMKVVGIGEHKGRCYEYLPIMTVPREEATSILHDLDFDTLEIDEDYAIRELESLEEKAKEGFAAESRKYDFNIPHVSTMEIKTIVRSLEDMRNSISKRVVSLD
jgi:hypothetical protein